MPTLNDLLAELTGDPDEPMTDEEKDMLFGGIENAIDNLTMQGDSHTAGHLIIIKAKLKKLLNYG